LIDLGEPAGNIVVLFAAHLASAVNDIDFGAKCAEEMGRLSRDIASSDHRSAFGLLRQAQRFIKC
tara:strand:+ start:462 stop:656 length:195 start_codon:yes stop_codon:yes gene_type:complete